MNEHQMGDYSKLSQCGNIKSKTINKLFTDFEWSGGIVLITKPPTPECKDGKQYDIAV